MDKKLVKALFKGLITYLPFSMMLLGKRKEKSLHSSSIPLFSYAFWLRTVKFLNENNLSHHDLDIAELGSGGSFGIGICALLSGCRSYTVLDVEDKFSKELNLSLLDSIIHCLSKELPIPDENEYSKINLRIKDYSFPKSILSSNNYKDDNFISMIKKDLQFISEQQYHRCHLIHYYPYWSKQKIDQQCDLLISRAVMEHVSDPETVYHAVKKVLSEKALQMHDIEFHSHNVSDLWDGHLRVSEFLWKIIRGKRDYYLNRWNFQQHATCIQNSGFSLLASTIVKKKPTYSKDGIYGAAVLFRNNNS